MNQDTIVLNVPDEIDSDIFNCICKFINLFYTEFLGSQVEHDNEYTFRKRFKTSAKTEDNNER